MSYPAKPYSTPGLTPTSSAQTTNPIWGIQPIQMAAGYDQTLSDLPFLPLNHYREASRRCLVCALVGHMIGDHLPESQDAHHVSSVGLWRPLTVQRPTMDNLEERIAVPIKCVLPVCIRTMHEDISRPETYKRLVLELNLELCCAEHGDDCNEESPQIQLPPGFHVVDTVLNCVVHLHDIISPPTATAAFKFAALSYQWRTATAFPTRDLALRTANTIRLGAQNSLDLSQPPKVIADAMRACQDLGIRYLWIQGMAAIYQLAHVTIVALADGVGAGLPGVSRRPRGDHGLPTFQEKALSKRRIFFGAHHVCLGCNRSEGSLETILAKHLGAPQTHPGHHIPPGPHTSSIWRGLQHESAYPFGIYAEAAEDYAA
ncbi:hypothetical protein B0T22DRAFT_491418 [Podospora appendiculata]|uniref:Heterokaryon incompatibility domain-containing protein n=1 Tax=Podospora appendiculata TaxID=314037 RepID=A0AAE1CDX5_9PEZI|nr:hypothetical protein B0T22DRAFT_491418 [Podospora appendiculata]